jgi:hypothetical protein
LRSGTRGRKRLNTKIGVGIAAGNVGKLQMPPSKIRISFLFSFSFIFINIYWLQLPIGILFAVFSFDSEELCEVKAVDVTASIVAAKRHVFAFSLKDTLPGTC